MKSKILVNVLAWFVFTLALIWGWAFAIHAFAGTWMEIPVVATGMLGVLVGVAWISWIVTYDIAKAECE
jgi:hypothetical protein